MPTYSAIDCSEVRGTATSAVGIDGTSASVTLRATAANEVALVQDLLNNRRVFPGFTGSGAPRVSNITNIRGAGESSLDPTSNGQRYIWDDVLIDVDYAPLNAIIPADPEVAGYDLIVETFETLVEGRRLDHNPYRWNDTTGDQLKPGEAPVKLVGRAKLVREYIGWSAIPADVLSKIGLVNQAPYTSTLNGLTFATETLLYGEPQYTQTIRTNGNEGFNFRLQFAYKAEGWNSFWREKTEAYARIYSYLEGGAPTPADIYEVGDFSQLFQ